MDYLKPYNAHANIIKDTNGFGSPLLLTFLALLSSLLIVAAFVRFSVDSRSDFRFFCYNDLHAVQKILINHEQQLMALNPVAQALRVRIRLLYIQLALAIAAENLPLVAQITKWILQAKEQQRALRLQQQMLISFGTTYARLELTRTYKDLLVKNRTRSQAWSQILQIQDSISMNTFLPVMAVSPDNRADIAPVYKYNPGFENQQRIQATWMFWFFAKPSFQTLIPADYNWRLQCSIEPKNQPQGLLPTVKADKL